MWIKLVDVFLEPLINSWRAVKAIERDLVKDDGETAPPQCVFTVGRLWRRRRCSLAAFHDGEHRYQ